MRRVILLLVIIIIFFPAHLFPDNMDLIVMIDTSESMFPYFQDLMNYLIKDLLTGNLHKGDTFHLLSFAGKPEIDISEKIKNKSTIEKILKKLLILQPLGKYTDLVRAIKFLYQYTKELPETNKKTILLLTDGIHDPPPYSPYRFNSEEILKNLLAGVREIKKEGWSVHIIKFPGKITAKPEAKKSYLSEMAGVLEVPIVTYSEKNKKNIAGYATGFPKLYYPENLGSIRKNFKMPLTIRNYSDKPLIIRLNKIILLSQNYSGINILKKPYVKNIPPEKKYTFSVRMHLPARVPAGNQTARIKFFFNNDLRISPKEGNITFNYTGTRGISFNTQILLYILYTIFGIVIIYLFIRLFIYLKNRISDLSFSEYSEYVKVSHNTASRPIEMRVSFQNPYIGFRNIHSITPGSSKSIGGGSSSYLIFLVPVPRKIGIIKNTDGHYVFIPLIKEFFPFTDNKIVDCLNRNIQVESEKGYKMNIIFKEYISQLEKINQLMHSIDSTGSKT
ncbi:MAG: VWA domain-containing protein [Spirochaetes bacterium]|nr:VWA domain-containing protein [Spirochaetota bacterium]